MLRFKTINKEEDFAPELTRDEFVDFLYKHLDRFGDSRQAIQKSLRYAFSDQEGKGGFLLAAWDEDELVGELVMIDTGMGGYIPEHFLVYVAVDPRFRGRGYGRRIIEKGLDACEGDVALHVEYDNPAKRLYERIGFSTKYAEMRYRKED